MDNTISRRNVLKTGCAAVAGLSLSGMVNTRTLTALPVTGESDNVEWRNRQPGMAYRRLGRTGYMVSEIVMGGNTIAPDNNKHVEMAVEHGLNYFDTSPAYGNGKSEEGYGELLKKSSMREKVFVNSKVSIFDSNRNTFYWELFKTLSESDQKKIQDEATELIEKRGIKESRYMGRYGTWQFTEIEKAYFGNIMEKYYGDKIDRRQEYYDRIINSVEDSLKRLKTDYLDLFMCPHGANSPEEVVIPEIHEALEKLKQDGKIRAFGLSAHTDPGYILLTAVNTGIFDAVMIAYSIVNAEFCHAALRFAYDNNVGVIAMKAARPLYPDRDYDVWVPPDRLEKLNHMIPEKMKVPMKAYLWVLQNPYITCVNCEMKNAEQVNDNLPLAGRKVELVPLEDQSKFAY
ncbi:MAG: aldo/keto reductase [Candidatus Latescibacteria bacterium]|nr:aldo/keto reductase [Candidatus Latescibacterota bacterium]